MMTAPESQFLLRNFELQTSFSSFLHFFHEMVESLVHSLLSLSVSLFLFHFFHFSLVLSPVPAVDIISCWAYFLVELDVLDFLIVNQDWVLQVEMKHDEYLLSARLEEGKLDVRKENVQLGPILCSIPETIPMDLQSSKNSLRWNLRPADKAIKPYFVLFVQLETLLRFYLIHFVPRFYFFLQVFDLFVHFLQVFWAVAFEQEFFEEDAAGWMAGRQLDFFWFLVWGH